MLFSTAIVSWHQTAIIGMPFASASCLHVFKSWLHMPVYTALLEEALMYLVNASTLPSLRFRGTDMNVVSAFSGAG